MNVKIQITMMSPAQLDWDGQSSGYVTDMDRQDSNNSLALNLA